MEKWWKDRKRERERKKKEQESAEAISGLKMSKKTNIVLQVCGIP